jgi:hypothetical protein
MIRWIMAVLLLTADIATAQDAEWETAIGQKDQVTKGLVAYWSMRNSGTTVFDEWGTSTAVSTNGGTFAKAVVGNGITLDGTNDYIVVSGISSTTKVFTFSCWAKSSQANTTYKYLMDIESGRVNFQWFGSSNGFMGVFNGTINVPMADAPNDGLWHHIAFSAAVNDIILYVDGARVGNTVLYAGVNIGGQIAIGSRYTAGTTEFFQGSLDEVRLYNRALTADEIKQLYRMGKVIYENR